MDTIPIRSDGLISTIKMCNNANDVDDNKASQSKKQRLYSSIKKHLWIFPLTCFIGTLIITIVPYILSVYYGYTNKIFPLISDSGGYPPGASLFSSFLIIGAIFSKYLYQRIDDKYRSFNSSFVFLD